MPQDSVFTPQMLDCMAGLESAWDPTRDGPNGRTGLFQYNQRTWEGEYGNDGTIPWSRENAHDVATNVRLALSWLNEHLGIVQKKRPDLTTLEAQIQRAIALWGTGNDSYGAAIIECARLIDTDFAAALRPIWKYLNP